jgi:hypothetical protein
MAKSLEEIWNEMEQKRLLEKQIVEQKEQSLYEQREIARQEYLKTMRMYEAASSANSAAGAGGAGGTKKKYFITITDTMWLYPIADTEYALTGTTYSYTRNENTLTFNDQDSLIAVYLEIFNRTAVTQPLGSNIGYSLGVGTILRDLKQELYFKINDQLMVTWRLVEQITNQTDLPPGVGGGSTDGTIGYVTVLENWPDPLPNSYLDLALITDYNY